MSDHTGHGETQAAWLASKFRRNPCSVADAEERLRAFHRAAWRLTASDCELRADAEYEATLRVPTGARVVLDEAPVEDDGQLELPAVRCAA